MSGSGVGPVVLRLGAGRCLGFVRWWWLLKGRLRVVMVSCVVSRGVEGMMGFGVVNHSCVHRMELRQELNGWFVQCWQPLGYILAELVAQTSISLRRILEVMHIVGLRIVTSLLNGMSAHLVRCSMITP